MRTLRAHTQARARVLTSARTQARRHAELRMDTTGRCSSTNFVFYKIISYVTGRSAYIRGQQSSQWRRLKIEHQDLNLKDWRRHTVFLCECVCVCSLHWKGREKKRNPSWGAQSNAGTISTLDMNAFPPLNILSSLSRCIKNTIYSFKYFEQGEKRSSWSTAWMQSPFNWMARFGLKPLDWRRLHAKRMPCLPHAYSCLTLSIVYFICPNILILMF